MLTDFINAANESMQELREEIHEVQYYGDGIRFIFRGMPFQGVLKGRNTDLILGVGKDQDRAIALRVLLDGHATQIVSGAMIQL